MREIIRLGLAVVVIGLAGSWASAADGLLGVELQENNGNVVISKVIPGTGAVGAFKVGDLLVRVGDTNIGSIQDALDAKADAPNNANVRFVIERGGFIYVIKGRFKKGQPYGTFTAPERE